MTKTTNAQALQARIVQLEAELAQERAKRSPAASKAGGSRSDYIEDMLDAVPDGVALIDAEGRYAYCNKAVREETGLTREQVAKGVSLHDVIRLQESYGDTVVADGRRLSVEERVARVRDPAGSRFERRLPSGKLIEFIFMPLREGRTLGVFRDITEHKQRQFELEKARDEIASGNRLLTAILEGMKDGATLFDDRKRLLYANGAFGTFVSEIGLDVESGKTRLAPLVRAIVAGRKLFLDDGNTARLADLVTRMATPEGVRFSCELASGRHVEFDFRQVPGGHILGMYRDVTDAKHRELQLHQVQDEVTKTQKLMSNVLRKLPVNVAVFDREGRIIYGNGKLRASDYGLPDNAMFKGVRLVDVIKAQIAVGDHQYDDDGRPLTLPPRTPRGG